jgi:DNA-binding winged helix-turn-helix (wHTH) protein/tetratricopeptide (TPR) repeat protein
VPVACPGPDSWYNPTRPGGGGFLAVLGRYASGGCATPAVSTFEFGTFELREASCELLRDGMPLRVERRVYDVLVYLIRHRDRVVPAHELLQALWGGVSVTRGSLARAVRLVREVLGDPARSPIWIATLHGRGYRFIGEVREAGEASPEPLSPRAQRTPGAAAASDVLVGREPEVERLSQAMDAARHGGGGRVCFISGEPGIGKTRLAEEMANRAVRSGWRVLSAWCHDGEGAPSYWPWIQLLRAHIAETKPAELRSHLGPGLEVIGESIPELRHVLGVVRDAAGSPREEARFYLFDAITRLFMAAARRKPLLLLLDDLHTCDAPSLRLLAFLCREGVRAPLLVLGTHRSSDMDMSELFREVLGEIERHGHCERIPLSGLSRGAVGSLVAATNPRVEVDACWVDRVHRRTAGNPFFVRELVRSAEASAGEHTDAGIPPAVRDVIASRVARLSSPCREVLRTASIVATEWPVGLVHGISGLSQESFADALDEGLACGVIRSTDSGAGAAFSHALIRETLYADIPTTQRQRMHRSASEWLEAHGPGDLAGVAYHAGACAALDGGRKAREYSIRAADAAMRRLAYEDAAAHYARALALLGPGADVRTRCELSIALGEAHMSAGAREQATRTLWAAARLARELESGPLLGRVALGLAPGVLSLEVLPARAELVSLVRHALELCTDDHELSSRLLARLALALMWTAPAEETQALVERAIELARTCKSPGAEAFAYNARFVVRWSPANLDERLREAPELLACTLRSGDRSLEVVCRVVRFSTMLEAGDVPELGLELEAFDRLADELRQPQAMCYRAIFRGCLAMLEGRYADMTALREETLKIAESVGDVNARHAAGAFEIFLAWEEGRFNDALAVANRGSSDYAAWRHPSMNMLAESGRLDEARALLRNLCPEGRVEMRWDLLWLCHIVNACETCNAVGDEEIARPLYAALRPYRDRICVMGYGWGVWGSAERTLGMLATLLGKWEEAEDHFAAALRVNGRLGARAMMARTRYQYAQMLIARGAAGDRMRAKQLIDDARAEAQALGLRDVLRRLDRMRS